MMLVKRLSQSRRREGRSSRELMCVCLDGGGR
jgi:hypothetical protein